MDRIMAAITYNRICELGSLSAAARSDSSNMTTMVDCSPLAMMASHAAR